jgi:hypothetical protein
MADTHLFLALTASAFGELALGVRLAKDLEAAGDDVVFLGPTAGRLLFEGTAIRHRPAEPLIWQGVELGVRDLLREQRCRSLALVDATSVTLGVEEVGEDPSFLAGLDVPVVALDYWNLPEAGLRWDYGPDATPIPPVALQIPRRLMPVPICRPTAGPGVYDALPEAAVSGGEEEERRSLGLGASDRLVLIASSRFWDPAIQVWHHHRALARFVPELIRAAIERLGPSVHLVHVGPISWEPGGLGDRYHFVGQVAPDRLARLLAAAQLLLTLNTTGGTTVAAVASGVPVVAAVNSFQGRTADDVLAAMGRDPDDPLRPWLERVAPLFRFRLFPLGLFDLLTPVLAGNPYVDAIRTVELLDGAALTAACRELLFDDAAREELRGRQQAFCRRARALPPGAEVYRSLL